MASIHTRWGRDPALHACAGVLCDRHERCARYDFVNGTREPSAYWLPACFSFARPGHFPAFIPIGFMGPPTPEQWHFDRRSAQRVQRERTALVLNPA